MTLLRWQQNIVDEEGNVLPSATVEIRDEVSGSLVNLFEDIDGLTPKGNPLTVDSDGYGFAYMEPGRFKITATSADQSFTKSWRDVRLANDFSDLDSRINQRVIYVDSVADLPAGFEGQQAIAQGVPFAFESASWRPSAGYVTPEAFGAVGDDSADDITAWQAAIDSGAAIQPSDTTYFCSTSPNFSSGVSLLPSGAVIRIGDGQHTTGNINLLDAGGLTITGTTIETDTVSDISVSGAAGAWAVTGTVSDGTKFAVGDVVRVSNTVPGARSPGTIPAARPKLGELRLGFFQMGGLTVAGTTATVGGGGVNTYLAVSDLLLIKGQVRRVVSITNDTSFEIASALANDVDDLQYWYYIDNVTNGTVDSSGSNNIIDFSSATFTNQVEVGSIIFIADLGARRVISVNSGAQTATLSSVVPNGTNKVWGVVSHGELHDGAWIVTGVSGNDVTWTNTTEYQLPSKNLVFTSADISCPKTKLEFSGNGTSVFNGQLNIYDLAMAGNGTGNGADLRSEPEDSRFGKIAVNASTSIHGFSYGVWANSGSVFFGQECAVSANTARGVNATEGGQAYMESATVTGNTGIGVFVGPGSYVRFANGRSNGNSGDGMRMEVGASTWSDFAYFNCNGGNGLLGVGGVNVHHVGARINCNGGDGIDGQNGIYGRATGCLLIGNDSAGARMTKGSLELNQCNTTGNGASGGVVVTTGSCKVNEAGVAGNTGSGVLALEVANVTVTDTNITFENIGINSQGESTVYGSNTGITGNGTDASISTGGKISLSGASALPSANVALNTQTSTFGYVADY